MIRQPTSEELKRFVAGDLDTDATERILTYLSENDDAVETVDTLWQEINLTPSGGDSEVPELDDATAAKVEQQLFDRIHRTDLTGDVLRLGTQAASTVYWALLRPFVTRIAGTNDEIEKWDTMRHHSDEQQ